MEKENMIQAAFKLGLLLFLSFASSLSLAYGEEIALSVQEGKIYLPCQFDLFKTACLLDSGSSFSSVKSSDFANYPVIGKIDYNGGSGTGIEADKIKIHDLRVAGLDFKDWPVARMPEVPIYLNLIGLDVFAKTPVSFDLIKLKIQANPPSPTAASLLALRMDLGMILLPLQIGDTPLEAVWDSGATTSVIDQDYIAQHPDDFTYIKEVAGSDASGRDLPMKRYQIKKLQLGSLQLTGVAVVAMDFSGMHKVHPQFPLFFLGYNILIDHLWYFDLANYHWTVH